MTISDTRTPERRFKKRFHIQRDLTFKVWDRGKVVQSGAGNTLDMCSAGIAFHTDQPLGADLSVELSISWPALLHDVRPIRLKVFGRIIRTGADSLVCLVERYEFRTQGALQNDFPAGKPMGMRWTFSPSPARA